MSSTSASTASQETSAAPPTSYSGSLSKKPRHSLIQRWHSRSNLKRSTHFLNSHDHLVTAIPSSNILEQLTHDQLQSVWSSIRPPGYPYPRQYASCYCEENTYLLIQHLASVAHSLNAQTLRKRDKCTTSQVSDGGAQNIFLPIWDVRSVFVSNDTKTVLLCQQRASSLANAGYPVVWDYHVFAAVTCTLVPLKTMLQSTLADDVTRSRSKHFVTGLSSSSTSSPSLAALAIPQIHLTSTNPALTRTWIYDADSWTNYDPLSPQPPQNNHQHQEPPKQATDNPSPILVQDYISATFQPQAISIPQHLRSKFRVTGANQFLHWFATDRSHMLGPSPPPPSWPPIVGTMAARIGIINNLMDNYVSMNTGGIQDGGENRYGKVLDASSWFHISSWTLTSCPGQTVNSETIGQLALSPPPHHLSRIPSSAISITSSKSLPAVISVSPLSSPPSSVFPVSPSLPSSYRLSTSMTGPMLSLSSSPPLDKDSSNRPNPSYLSPPQFHHHHQSSRNPTIKRYHSQTFLPTSSSSDSSSSPHRGGRIANPLFPAYLFASSHHRATVSPASRY